MMCQWETEDGLIDVTKMMVYFGPEYLMQFTGLKDKNDKEIYEGDILSDGRGSDAVVEWKEQIAAFVCDADGEVLLLNEGDPKRDMKLRYTSVIGNIYENLELLK